MRIPEYVKDYIFDGIANEVDQDAAVVPIRQWLDREMEGNENQFIKILLTTPIPGESNSGLVYSDLIPKVFYFIGSDKAKNELVEHGVKYFKERSHLGSFDKRQIEELIEGLFSSYAYDYQSSDDQAPTDPEVSV